MAIEEKDLARLDERYVKKDDCTVLRSETDRRIDSIKEDITVVKTKLNILIGILSGIGAGVLTIALKLLFKVG